MDSPFEVLDVEPGASDREVVRAYRRRVKEVHPDQGGSGAQFRRVKEAYEAIRSGDPDEWTPPEPTTDDAGDDEPDGPDEDGGGDRTDEAGVTVEYLNYEVLSDQGWDIGDADLFEKAADAGLDAADYGTTVVDPGEYLLDAIEDCGLTWPYSCRGGACANCAIAMIEGDISTPANHILPPEMIERDIRLSCVGAPVTEDMKVVYNVKHLPGLAELRLPPGPFDRVRPDD